MNAIPPQDHVHGCRCRLEPSRTPDPHLNSNPKNLAEYPVVLITWVGLPVDSLESVGRAPISIPGSVGSSGRSDEYHVPTEAFCIHETASGLLAARRDTSSTLDVAISKRLISTAATSSAATNGRRDRHHVPSGHYYLGGGTLLISRNQ